MPTIRDPDPDESDGEYEPSDDEGDQLTLEDLKFFTRLEQATDDLELTELDETESQEVTAGKKTTGGSFEGAAGDREKRALLRAWDRLDRTLKDFVHETIFPAVVKKALAYRTPRGHQIFHESQPTSDGASLSSQTSPILGISINSKVHAEFPFYAFHWFENELQSRSKSGNQMFSNPRQFLEVVIALGISRASCPNDMVQELTTWAAEMERYGKHHKGSCPDLNIRRFSGQGDERGRSVTAAVAGVAVYTIRNESISVRDYVGYSIDAFKRFKEHQTCPTRQMTRLFPSENPSRSAPKTSTRSFIVSDFSGHSPATALIFETVIIVAGGLTDVHKVPTPIEKTRLGHAVHLSPEELGQQLQRLQFNVVMPGAGFFLSVENRKFTAEDYEKAWVGICEIAREQRRLPRLPNIDVSLRATGEWQRLLTPFIGGDHPLYSIHHLLCSFWAPGSKGAETIFLREIKEKTGVDLPADRGLFERSKGGSYPRTAQWMSALAAEKPPSEKQTKQELVRIKKDVAELEADDKEALTTGTGARLGAERMQARHASNLRRGFPYDLFVPTAPSKHGWQKIELSEDDASTSTAPFDWRPPLDEQDQFVLDLWDEYGDGPYPKWLSDFATHVNQQGSERYGGLCGWRYRQDDDVADLLHRHRDASYVGHKSLPRFLGLSNKALTEENVFRLRHLERLASSPALFMLPVLDPYVINHAAPPILQSSGDKRLDINVSFSTPVFETNTRPDALAIVRRTWLCEVIGLEGLCSIVVDVQAFCHISRLLFQLVAEAYGDRSNRQARRDVPAACKAYLKEVKVKAGKMPQTGQKPSAPQRVPLALNDDAARNVIEQVRARHNLEGLDLLRVLLFSDPFAHPLWTELEVRLGAATLATSSALTRAEIVQNIHQLQDYWTLNIQRLILGPRGDGDIHQQPHYLPVSYPTKSQWRHDRAVDANHRGGNHAEFDDSMLFAFLKKLALAAPDWVFEVEAHAHEVESRAEDTEIHAHAREVESRLIGFALEIANGHHGPYWYKWMLHEIWGDWMPIFYGNRAGEHDRTYYYKIRQALFRWFLIYQRFECNLDGDIVDRLLLKYHERNKNWDYAPFLISRATGEPALTIASRMVDLKKTLASADGEDVTRQGGGEKGWVHDDEEDGEGMND